MFPTLMSRFGMPILPPLSAVPSKAERAKRSRRDSIRADLPLKSFFTLLVLSADAVGLVLAGLYVAKRSVAVDLVAAGWRHPAGGLLGVAVAVGCLVLAARWLERRKRAECSS